MTDDLDERIRERQAGRFKILEALYRRKIMGSSQCEVADLARDTSMEPKAAFDHVCFLYKHGLVDMNTGGEEHAIVRLMHDGEVEVERVVSGQATRNFPANIHNYISIGTMNQSQIQQGMANSSATLTVTNITDDHRQKLDTLFRSLRGSAAQLGLDEETRRDLKDSLDTGQSELKRRKPSVGVLREVLKSLRTISEGAGGALAAQYLPQIGELIRMLGG